MPHNVVILTTGLSGSSVLTGLIARAGYWTGNETVVKDNSSGRYDTFENRELVELNESLITASNETVDQRFWYRTDLWQTFSGMEGPQKETVRQFVAKSNQHSPWIWKDPKLWQTMPYWLQFLDLSKVKFIILYRRSFPLWVSQTSKRIIYDYFSLRNHEQRARKNIHKYLEQEGAHVINVEYDELVKKSQLQIERLNKFLDTQITIADWNTIYRSSSTYLQSVMRNIKAIMIYIKNYGERIQL
jgi:hypothetical protein